MGSTISRVIPSAYFNGPVWNGEVNYFEKFSLRQKYKTELYKHEKEHEQQKFRDVRRGFRFTRETKLLLCENIFNFKNGTVMASLLIFVISWIKHALNENRFSTNIIKTNRYCEHYAYYIHPLTASYAIKYCFKIIQFVQGGKYPVSYLVIGGRKYFTQMSTT
jgi:hypothetical protein